MRAELNPASRRAMPKKEFVDDYRIAQQTATLRSIHPGSPDDPTSEGGATVVRVPMGMHTIAFGEADQELSLPFADGGIAWDPSLVFPGLSKGERLRSSVELAPRAPIFARDGSALADGPAEARSHPLGSAAIDVTGEVGAPEPDRRGQLSAEGYPPGTPVGISGLEQAFNSRLAGKPGGGRSPRVMASSPGSSPARTRAGARR